MSELLKKQNYGVEVEFTGISRKMAADAVAEIIGTAASRPDRTCYQTRTIQDSQGRKWKVMRDSSIHPIRKVGTENMDEYRVEFVTPVLKYEDLDTLQAIIRKFREIGGVPHSSSYATVKRQKGSRVPVAVWNIDSKNEKALDLYEGYPRFYKKRNVFVQLKNGTRKKAMIYSRHFTVSCERRFTPSTTGPLNWPICQSAVCNIFICVRLLSDI